MTEIENLLTLTYDECCNYLKNKYGEIKDSYFCNETCKTRKQSIKRTKEGLYIHHIDEDKYPNLSNKKVAINSPFSCQNGDRLVYCNILEHLLLHIKIFEYPNPNRVSDDVSVVGTYCYLIPELNDIYCDYPFKQPHKQIAAKLVYNLKDDYLKCIKHLMTIRCNSVKEVCSSWTFISLNDIPKKYQNLFDEFKQIYNELKMDKTSDNIKLLFTKNIKSVWLKIKEFLNIFVNFFKFTK